MAAQLWSKTTAVAKGYLRPNLVTVERRSSSSVSPTGSALVSTVTINAGIPALIDFKSDGTMHWLVEGTLFTQDAELFIDGLRPDLVEGHSAGATITVGGVAYIVTANGKTAFPDLKANDRVTDERGATYLVLAVEPRYLTYHLEAKLARGRAW